MHSRRFPVGHPDIYINSKELENAPLQASWFGLVKAILRPPRGLHVPCLPYRTEKMRLLFSLCTSTHLMARAPLRPRIQCEWMKVGPVRRPPIWALPTQPTASTRTQSGTSRALGVQANFTRPSALATPSSASASCGTSPTQARRSSADLSESSMRVGPPSHSLHMNLNACALYCREG